MPGRLPKSSGNRCSCGWLKPRALDIICLFQPPNQEAVSTAAAVLSHTAIQLTCPICGARFERKLHENYTPVAVTGNPQDDNGQN